MLSKDVFARFDRELVSLGWKPDQQPILSSGDLHGWGSRKPQLCFRYGTAYDARLQGTTDPCPSPR